MGRLYERAAAEIGIRSGTGAPMTFHANDVHNGLAAQKHRKSTLPQIERQARHGCGFQKKANAPPRKAERTR
ncbi:MAG: hypothetical protein LC098_07265 [Burkholderiales bacterium]|nr:hypothetical protein [Burkholderiales bacterium]